MGESIQFLDFSLQTGLKSMQLTRASLERFKPTFPEVPETIYLKFNYRNPMLRWSTM